MNAWPDLPLCGHRISRCILGVALVALGGGNSGFAGDWPGWRGPRGDFATDTKDLADSWPEDGPRRIWSRALGAGYSAVSAVDDRLYTMYRDGDSEVVEQLPHTHGPDVGNKMEAQIFATGFGDGG